jgi:hypothetical protein
MRWANTTMEQAPDGSWVIKGRWGKTTIVTGNNIPQDMATHLRLAVEQWLKGARKK